MRNPRHPVAYSASIDEEFLKTISIKKCFPDNNSNWRSNFEKLVRIILRRLRMKKLDLFNQLRELNEFQSGSTSFEHFQNTLFTQEFPENKSRSIVNYLFNKGLVDRAKKAASDDSESGDAAIGLDSPWDKHLFQAMMNRLSLDDAHMRNAKAILCGTYQFWRHSTSVPGYFVKGILKIKESPDDRPIYSEAKQSFVPQNLDEDVSKLHLDERSERFLGYVFLSRAQQCIILGRGDRVPGLRLTLFTDLSFREPHNRESSKIFSMVGFAAGLADQRGFGSLIYAERISDVWDEDNPEIMKHTNLINIYSQDRVPPKILAIINRHRLIEF